MEGWDDSLFRVDFEGDCADLSLVPSDVLIGISSRKVFCTDIDGFEESFTKG
ncbi:hypothetical protein QJS10_CPA16g01229 [Acorus calamus]|uniref:Uncharacterized protein n=1 Tax=Acorus calamus TaxID=4465 RepID=A0AAV9D1P8_ACOCL|nr:hypothetical protein QJS10_CPA16g01229 [Acorus calamus]